MNAHNNTTKRFLASALLTTGLLGAVPLIGDEFIQPESLQTIQEQVSRRIETQLCNKRYQCSKTGLVIQFLPNSKALFIHPESAQTIRADYAVHFNRHIAINVYENPSKNFDLMMHDVTMRPEGFVTSVNREDRYFQKV
jgi:hypothetical protein